MENNTYQKFAKYYDEYVKEFCDDLKMYNDIINGKMKILEVGCGTGRVLKNILENGYKIDGIDISDEMLEIAKEKLAKFIENGSLKLINHNFIDSKYTQKYEVILITYYTFNYILDNNSAEVFLENIRNSLLDNGILVMDLFYPSSMINKDINGKWTKKKFNFENTEYQILDKREMDGEHEERIQQYVNLNNGTIDEIKTIRKYYSAEFIEIMLKRLGFREILISNGYSKGKTEVKSNFIVKAIK